DRGRSRDRRGIVRPPDSRDAQIIRRIAEVEPRLAAAEVDRIYLSAVTERVRGVQRGEDLAPRGAAVRRAPGTVAEDPGVNGARRVRVVLQAGDAALEPVDAAGGGRRVHRRLALQVSREGEGRAAVRRD